MDQTRVDFFLSAMSSKLPAEKMLFVRDRLLSIDDSRFSLIQTIDFRDPTMMLLISFFLGGLGVDRFMLGQTGLGIAKLLTCGGLGIWALVDLFLVMGNTREQNFQKLMTAA